MKKLVYICVLLLLIACSNNKTPSNLDTFESIPELFDEKEEVFEYETIAKQKLQDYFDLVRLKENYPDFHSELRKVASDTIQTSRGLKEVTIQNLRQIGNTQMIADSIKRLTLSFDIVSDKLIIRDTVFALIKTRVVNIDNKEMVATKVSFKK